MRQAKRARHPDLHAGCLRKELPTVKRAASSDDRPAKAAELRAWGALRRYPREIPELPWYRHTVPQMVMAGFLPFSAIYIEL